MKRYVKALLVGFVLSTAFLLYVDVRQAQVIQSQRKAIVEMYFYILAGCPTTQQQ